MRLLRKREDCITEVIVADTHFGSAFGLMPPDFRNSMGAVAGLNVGQKYLWECWQHALDVLPRKFDVLVLNGDLTHGQNPKELARDVTEPDPEWQQRAAYQGLLPLVERAGAVYGTMGSEYHVGVAGQWEEQLLCRLGAVPDAWGHHARDWLGLDLEGVRQDVAHSQSVFTRYRASGGEREIQFEALVSDVKGGRSHAIVRSHVHTYFEVFIEDALFLSTPAFQLSTRWARTRKMRQRFVQKYVGIVVLRLYPGRVGKRMKVVKADEPIWFDHPKWPRDKYER